MSDSVHDRGDRQEPERNPKDARPVSQESDRQRPDHDPGTVEGHEECIRPRSESEHFRKASGEARKPLLSEVRTLQDENDGGDLPYTIQLVDRVLMDLTR